LQYHSRRGGSALVNLLPSREKVSAERTDEGCREAIETGLQRSQLEPLLRGSLLSSEELHEGVCKRLE